MALPRRHGGFESIDRIVIGQGDALEPSLGGPLNDGLGSDFAVRGCGVQMEVDVPGGQRRYPVSGDVHDGCDRRNNSCKDRSLRAWREWSRCNDHRGLYRTTRSSRSDPVPRVKMRANSSFTY
jgi:hypothetical protein